MSRGSTTALPERAVPLPCAQVAGETPLKMGSRCESGAVPATVSGIPNDEVNEPLILRDWEGDSAGRESGDLPE